MIFYSNIGIMDILLLLISLRNQFIYFAICLCIPSVILYIVEIITILRHKKFHNSFFVLFLLRAITDLLYVLDSYYGYRLPTLCGDLLLPLYSKFPNFMLVMFYFLSNATFEADNLATVLILINRLTAIALPLKHEKLWNYLIIPSALVIFGIPILITCNIFEMDPFIQVIPNADNTTSFVILEKPNGTYLNDGLFMALIFAFFFLFLCALINIVTVILYKRQKSLIHSQQQTSDNIEKKLLVYSIATFIGHVLIAILMLALYWTTATDNQVLMVALYTQYPWIMDTCTVVLSSWLLLWASDSFRSQLLDDFVPKKLRIKQNITVVKVSNIVMVGSNSSQNIMTNNHSRRK